STKQRPSPNETMSSASIVLAPSTRHKSWPSGPRRSRHAASGSRPSATRPSGSAERLLVPSSSSTSPSPLGRRRSQSSQSRRSHCRELGKNQRRQQEGPNVYLGPSCCANYCPEESATHMGIVELVAPSPAAIAWFSAFPESVVSSSP